MPGASSSVERASIADAGTPISNLAAPFRLSNFVRPRIVSWAFAASAVLAVFFVHFRPWQGGLLEDWGLVLSWNTEGFGGFAARLPLTLARPAHLLPDYVGMALSNGGFVGYYAVLGAVAVAQLVAALWAVAPLTRTRLLKWAVALALALHPWWAAGDVLRFISAQVSILCVVLWLGASLRFLATGHKRWILVIILSPIFGLLTYQAPAAALVLGSTVLSLAISATWRRRAALVGLTVGASGAVVVWSLVLAPRLSSAVYESQIGSQNIDVAASIRAILRTVVLHAPSTALAALVVGVIVIALGFSQCVSQGHAWLLLVGVASAPLAALTYASVTLHLNDPERVAQPIGVMLWIVLCCLMPALGTHRLLRVSATAVLLTGTTVAALVGYGTWTRYAASQQVLINAVQSVRKDVPHNAQLVVADQSGRFGDVYLLLPPHLNLALDVEDGPGADAILCTPAGVTRVHPTAALYPIPTTPDCSTLLIGQVVTPLSDLVTSDGRIKIYLLPPPG